MCVLVDGKICRISYSFVHNALFFRRNRMSHQKILINGNGTPAGNLQTLQHYLVNNHIQQNVPELQPGANVHVQIVKQEQAQQRFIINRQYIQQAQSPQVQIVQQEAHMYWLIVEIESDDGLNSYALVESKDVVGQPSLEPPNTGKLVIVNLNGKHTRTNVVMTSSKI